MNSLSLEQAAESLRSGRPLIYPTETFFAIGCDALNTAALSRIYAIKRRSNNFPLPVIIGSLEQLELVAHTVRPEERRLMEAFWPGPLSLSLPVRPGVPPLLNGGGGRVVVRMSPHPAAGALCLASGLVLVSSSANLSGRPPARLAGELDAALLEQADLHLSGPEPQGGLPSTIVELLPGQGGRALRLLRAGAVSAAALAGQGFVCLE